jgi:hypothetical protein
VSGPSPTDATKYSMWVASFHVIVKRTTDPSHTTVGRLHYNWFAITKGLSEHKQKTYKSYYWVFFIVIERNSNSSRRKIDSTQSFHIRYPLKKETQDGEERNMQGEVMNKSSLENTQPLSRWEEEQKGK